MNERVMMFIQGMGMAVSEFERICQLSNGAVSKMGDNTRTSTLDKISKAFPNLNMTWLRTGDGEMLRSGVVSQSSTGDNSPNINGSGNANGGVRDMGGMIELQKGYQEMLRKSQSQIDRLLGIIERMQGGEGKE